MAYNPFAVFRRNQKGLFAVLTVFIMIMFTLSFGGGDIFQWLPRLLGSSRQDGDTVATVDGGKVTDGELSRVASQRGLASEFMMASNELARERFDRYITESIPNASRDNRAIFGEFHTIRSGRIPYVFNQQDMIQAMMNPDQSMFYIRRGMDQLRFFLNTIVNSATATTEDKNLAQDCMRLIDLDARRFDRFQGGYFGHKFEGDDNLRGPFEFSLWLRKADKLGIRYTAEDAKRMYLEEFHNQIDPAALAEMEKNVFNTRANYNRDAVFAALADEFRVRTAQNIVMGRGQATQVFPTPWETFEFYRKQCDGASYRVITVPTDNYISRVTGEPDAAVIRKIFNDYKSKEPDPSKDNLGLKEPRKLKIGWLEVKGDEAYYKKLGADSLAAAEAQARLFLIGVAPLPGTELMHMSVPSVMGMTDPALSGAYTAFRQKHDNDLNLAWFPFFTADALNRSGPLDNSILKPTHLGAAAAAAAGSLATFAGPLTMPLVFIEQARMDDRAARARVLAALLVPVNDAGGLALARSLVAAARLPDALPLSVVRTQLADEVKKKASLDAATRDIDEFEEEARKLGARADKSEAATYIETFIKERGLASGESKGFRDMYTLIQDEGLKPLVERQMRGRSEFELPEQFGRPFFFDFDRMSGREMAATSLYSPETFPDRSPRLQDGQASYLAWRTAEQPAEQPKDIEAVKPRIIDIWKKQEARKLAAAAAEQLAKEVREAVAKESSRESPAVIFRVAADAHTKYLDQQSTLADKGRCEFFRIENVSPISMPRNMYSFQPLARPQAFQLTPRRELPYPTWKMQSDLLENKDKPLGTAVVVNDESKDHYYVAVLDDRQFHSMPIFDLERQFYDQVYSGAGDLSNAIRQQYRGQEIQSAYREAIALLKAEFKVTGETDKLTDKKKPE